jgi:SAM-dependent methyltransferase
MAYGCVRSMVQSVTTRSESRERVDMMISIVGADSQERGGDVAHDIRTQLRRTWESAAPGWAKWEGLFAAGLADVTDTMLDMAGVAAGMRVLDLACGAGSQSLRAAERVGPKGQVVASDISATMLRHVQEAAKRRGFTNVETLECAAEDLPSTVAVFDAAISRLGLMLFAAPQRALQAVQSVLKPNARISALVFTTPSANPFMSKPMQILLRHAGREPPTPGKPGIFALGGPGVLEGLLAGSGLADVEARVVRAPLRLASAAEALEMMQQAFGAYRAVVADLGPQARAAAWSEVGECLGQFEGQEGFHTELELMIGSGIRAA